MNYLDFVVLAVPAIIGVAGALSGGPTKGIVAGAGAMVVVVFILLLFQVSGETRFGSALGLLNFEWYRWLPSFLVGAAVGALIYQARRSAR